jgi:PAS domain S-box-containing protein
MSDADPTKEELIEELRHLRRCVAALEGSEQGGRACTDPASTKEAATNVPGAWQAEPETFRRMFLGHGAMMYVVDLSTFAIIDANETALSFYGYDLETMLTKRIPDLNITPEAKIRAEVKRAVDEGRSYYVFKHRLANGEIRDVEVYANPITIRGKDYSFSIVHDVTDRRLAEEERDRLNVELQNALEEIKTLRGIIPICSFCKRIRDDQGFWNQVEVYVKEHSEVSFSHSLCPECAREHYPNVFNE